MDSQLQSFNDVLTDFLHQLQTTYAEDVKAIQTIPQDPKNIPPQLESLSDSIELLSSIQKILTPPLHTLVDGLFAFTISKALSTAVTYKIPDILNRESSLAVNDIAERTSPKTSPGALSQILRVLASSGIFAYDDQKQTYSNNAVSSLLTTTHWTRWHSWAELYPSTFYDIFANLDQAVALDEPRSATHITFNAQADESLYALLSRLPWTPKFFETIGAGSTAMAPGLLADYPWSEISPGPVCDLGGGNGEFLFTILSEFKDVKGAILELEDSVAHKSAALNLQTEGGKFASVSDRVVGLHGGNFFKEVPPYPFYTIRWTLHNWGDEQTVEILKMVRNAMGKAKKEGSRLLVIEAVVRDGRMGRPAAYGSLIMMSGNKAGKERTELEWRDACEKSGWRIHGIYTLRGCIPCILDLRPV